MNISQKCVPVKFCVSSTVTMLHRQLGKVLHYIRDCSTERLHLLATKVTCCYLHTDKMCRVESRHSCDKIKYAQDFSCSVIGHNQWNTSVQRCMWTCVKETMHRNNCHVIQPYRKVQSCLDHSVARTALLTELTTTIKPMTVQECCVRLQEMFLSCNVSEPDQSAQYIVAYVLGHKTVSIETCNFVLIEGTKSNGFLS